MAGSEMSVKVELDSKFRISQVTTNTSLFTKIMHRL